MIICRSSKMPAFVIGTICDCNGSAFHDAPPANGRPTDRSIICDVQKIGYFFSANLLHMSQSSGIRLIQTNSLFFREASSAGYPK